MSVMRAKINGEVGYLCMAAVSELMIDMVEAEEQRLQARDEAAHRKEAADKKAGKRTVAHIQSNEPQSHDHHDKAAEPKSGTH